MWASTDSALAAAARKQVPELGSQVIAAFLKRVEFESSAPGQLASSAHWACRSFPFCR